MKEQGPKRKRLTHGAAPVLFTSQEFVTKKQPMVIELTASDIAPWSKLIQMRFKGAV